MHTKDTPILSAGSLSPIHRSSIRASCTRARRRQMSGAAGLYIVSSLLPYSCVARLTYRTAPRSFGQVLHLLLDCPVDLASQQRYGRTEVIRCAIVRLRLAVPLVKEVILYAVWISPILRTCRCRTSLHDMTLLRYPLETAVPDRFVLGVLLLPFNT